MYIPAVPSTPMNLAYVSKQKDHFLRGVSPPDFPTQSIPEGQFIGEGKAEDITHPIARKAMGLAIEVI